MNSDMKENSIREYIKNIDFKRDDWDVNKIKQDMRSFLGEEPGIDVEYIKDVKVNENTNKSEEFLRPKSIKIVFYGLDNKFKKIEFKI